MACTLPYLVDSKRKRQLVFYACCYVLSLFSCDKTIEKARYSWCVFFFKLGGSIVVFVILNFKKVFKDFSSPTLAVGF